jgi:hypothetical protein
MKIARIRIARIRIARMKNDDRMTKGLAFCQNNFSPIFPALLSDYERHQITRDTNNQILSYAPAQTAVWSLTIKHLVTSILKYLCLL